MFTNREIAALSEEKQEKLLKLIEEKGVEYGVFPLSAEQERMWFLYQLDTSNPFYNGITAQEFDGEVKEEDIRATLKAIIDKQNILRTIFITIRGKSYQVVLDEYELPFETYDISQDNQEKRMHEIVSGENQTPFHLTEEIPIKAIFIKRGEKKSTLLIKLHHICSDGWSYGIFLQEFKDAYTQICTNGACKLTPLSYRYTDYGIWQNKMMQTEQYADQIAFWKETLKGGKEEILFCFEKKDLEKKSRGDAVQRILENEVLEQLKGIAQVHHTSVYIVTLALYFWNLWKYTSQETIQIGTPVANRQKEEYEKIMGYFANTLVLRANMDKNMTFLDLLEQVKEVTVNAMANQDVPFDKLVDALAIERSSELTPLFQIMFSLRNKTLASGDMMEQEELPNSIMSFHTMGAEYVDYIQFKMILTLTQYEDRMIVDLGYNKDIFEEDYMNWFLDDYVNLLHQVSQGRNPKLVEEFRTKAEYLLNKEKIDYIPSEIVVEANCVPVEEGVEFYEAGDLCVLGMDGSTVLPGRVGKIAVKRNGSDTWYLTGDRGYLDCCGKLQVTYYKYQRYKIGNEVQSVAALTQNILEETSSSACVITTHAENGKVHFMVYYAGNEEISNEQFVTLLKEDEREHITIQSIRLVYLPLDQYGTYDTKRLDSEIYEGIKNLTLEQQGSYLSELCKNAEKKNSLNISALYYVDSMKHESDNDEPESKELSYAFGGVLPELPYYTLRDLLEHQAQMYGDKKIRFIQYNEEATFLTYAQLSEEANKTAQGLYEKGIRKGEKVIMMTKRLDWFLKTLWGLIYLGAIPVPLGPVKLVNNEADAAVDKFKKVYGKLVHPLVLTSEGEKNDVAEVGEAFNMDITRLWSMEELPSEAECTYRTELEEKNTAIILFTSGSTGMPKGVELCHRNILKRSQATTIYNKQTDQDISLNWMPLDHVGGVVMFHIRDVFGGVEQIQVETAEIVKSPLLWMDYVNQYRVNLTWAPNFAYALVVQKRDEIKNYDWDLSCLRFILNGGELIQEKSSLDFLKVLRSKGLPQDAMYPSWGMSETSSGVLFSKYFGKRNYNGYVEVGEPIPGDEFRIVDDENQIVPQGVVGSLQIRGETVTKGYYDASDTNRESFTDDGWFITGDLAIMRDYQITLTGRNNDLVIINGVNYTCTEIENAALDTAATADVVVAVGVTGKSNVGEKLAVFYVDESSETDKEVRKKLRKGIFEKFGLQVDILVKLTNDEVPRGALEKVQRKKIKQRYQDGEYDERMEQVVESFDNWFYEEVWIPESYHTFRNKKKESYLIFADPCGMANVAGKRLEQEGNSCYYVYMGNENVMKDQEIILDYHQEESYQWLFKTLEEKNITCTTILHNWCYTTYGIIELEEAQNIGIYSLKELITCAEHYRINRIIIATNYVNAIGEKTSIMPEKATLIGFLRSAKLEIEHTKFIHVDFDLEQPLENGNALYYECMQVKTESDISYRDGVRLRMNIKQILLDEKDKVTPYVKNEGLYVVTGGLGGIGTHLTKYLITQYNAHIISVGRSNIQEQEEKRLVLERLQALGSVTYVEADISRPDEFKHAIQTVEQILDRQIDGIFHLAGTMDLANHYDKMTEHLVRTESKATYEAMFAAKINGTNEIFALAKERQNVNVVCFSSCNGVFGGNSFSAYSAANSYLDAKTYQMQQGTSASYVNINWSMWERTGMSESVDDNMSSISVAMGYQLITSDLGMPSLECLLQRNIQRSIVGIDGKNTNINQKYQSSYYLHVVQAEECEEEILTEMEGKVRTVWEEILGHSNFTKTDKFFEIGGNSIMSIQLAAAMNKISPIKIEVVDLFKYTSVERLAEYIQDNQKEEAEKEEDELVGMTF